MIERRDAMKFGFSSRSAWLLLLAFLVGQGLLLSSCKEGGEAPPQSGEQVTPVAQQTPAKPVTFEGEVVIYVVGPMSGRDAEKGQAQAAGARFAADELNRGGGLLNRKVVIKVINDAGEPERALAAAEEVAAATKAGEEVIGIVLHEASDPKLKSAKKIYLSSDSGIDPLVVIPASTEPLSVDIDDERFFRLSAPNLSQASEIVNVFQEWNLHEVVVVHTATPYGKALSRNFRHAAKDLDVTTLATFMISPDAASFANEVTRVRKINAPALFFAGGEIEAAIFLSELFGFEFQGTVFGTDRALSYNVIDELGCQAEGMNFASVLPDPATVMGSDQLASYASLEGRAAEPYTVAGYSAVEFIVRGFEKAGTLDAKQAADEARQTKIRTVVGEVAFDAQGQVKKPKIHFYQVQSRLFKESFAREVGTRPQVSQVPRKAKRTMLKRRFASGKKPIIFAGLNWGSAQFGNSIARFIVESGYDYPTYSISGSSVPMFQSLRKGDVHVYMEVWLPNTQELYNEAIAAGQVLDVGLYFGDAVQGWFVPRYVVEGDPKRDIKPIAPELKSVYDLKRYSHLFASKEQPGIGRLIDGSPGWFSSKIDCMKLKAYRLDDKYAQIITGSLDALAAELRAAYERGRPILVYMFGPSWPLASFDLKQLSEPEFKQERWSTDKGCAFPLNQVKIVVHSGLPQRAPEVVDFFGKLSLDLDEISNILLTMKEKNLKPEEAALVWLKENEGIWTSWISSDVAQRVKQALRQ